MDTLIQGLGDAWSAIAVFVPKLIGFLVILFIGWLIAKGVSKALGALLKRLGFGRLLDKAGLGNLARNSAVDPAGIIVKIVYYFILLIALQWAFSVFGTNNPVSGLLNQVIAYLPRIAIAVVLIVVAAAVAGVLRDLIRSALAGRPFGPMVGTIVFAFVVALGVIAAVNQLGIGLAVTTPVLVAVLATIGGILVVGVGGGLIRPMQSRWDNWLNRAERELSEGSAPRTQEMPQTTGEQIP
ncbi:MAG: hypothetical protein GEV07_03655 [Streptosporangiales bacterium]|nr:hypothetical protein [Streptosporangiales bacterium]